MLRFPPSRIDLTAADIASFESRWAVRQLAGKDTENVRIGRGPARNTKLGFVAASANTGRQRAESCSSHVTICTSEDEASRVHRRAASPVFELELTADSVEVSVTKSRIFEEKTLSHKARETKPSTDDRPLPTLPGPVLSTSREDPRIVHALTRIQHSGQHHDRSVAELRRHDSARDLSGFHATQVSILHESRPYPTLDPGAPVFVPRIRFGSTASSSVDVTEQQQQPHHLHGSSLLVERSVGTTNLRSRTSFERHTQSSSRDSDPQVIISPPAQSLDGVDGNSVRHGDRNDDQNVTRQRPFVGLDRYPAMRSLPAGLLSRRTSGSQRPVIFPRRRSSQQHLIEFERSNAAQRNHQQDHRPLLSVPRAGHRRPPSLSDSTNGRSTPNLLHSLSDLATRNISSSQLSSQVDLGASARDQRFQQSSTAFSESSALVREILSERDSPLERLMQKYGQASARPRSVGRSFDALPRASLLHGDPFGDESRDFQEEADEHAVTLASETTTAPGNRFSISPRSGVEGLRCAMAAVPIIRTPHKRELAIEDPVALALALPSPEVPSSAPSMRTPPHLSPPAKNSSPLMRSSSPLPGTPFLGSGPSSPLPPSCGLAAAITPRVPVYNDNRPDLHQPQTPADITRSSRRARGRAHTASTDQTALLPLDAGVATPHRHPYRHTFPSATAHEVTIGTAHVRAAAITEPATTMTGVAVRLDDRSSGENEIEGNLDGLEEDRRVWIRRREDGSLDITPPREGRYEKFLS